MKERIMLSMVAAASIILSSCTLVRKVDDNKDTTLPATTVYTEALDENSETSLFTETPQEQSREVVSTEVSDDFIAVEPYDMYVTEPCFLYSSPKAMDAVKEVSKGSIILISAISPDGVWGRGEYGGNEYYALISTLSNREPEAVTTVITTESSTSPAETELITVETDITTTTTTKKSITSTTSKKNSSTTTSTTTTEKPTTVFPQQTTSSTSYTGITGLNVVYYGGEKEQGDTIPKSDFTVEVDYADGRTVRVSDWTATGLGPLKEGNNTVIVTYNGITCEVVVFAKGIGGISYPSNPKSTTTNFGITFADVDRKITAVRDGVIISSGPDKAANSTGYAELGVLNKGDTIRCTGIGKNGWCRVITSSGTVGFVYNLYVK